VLVGKPSQLPCDSPHLHDAARCTRGRDVDRHPVAGFHLQPVDGEGRLRVPFPPRRGALSAVGVDLSTVLVICLSEKHRGLALTTVVTPACNRVELHSAPSIPTHAAANCGAGIPGRSVRSGTVKYPYALDMLSWRFVCCDAPHQLEL
jgi:hypothetical protein